MVEKLNDLRVYRQAERYCTAVLKLCRRSGFRRDRKLRDQVESANDSIKANISEGFEQGSDAQFVRYLQYSKGSVAEVVSRLGDAQKKGYITANELKRFEDEAERILNAIGKLIQYLDDCDWKDRGRYRSRLRAAERKSTTGSKDPKRNTLPKTADESPWLPGEEGPLDPASGD